MNDLLRKRIGFEGLIIGDYQGIDLVRKYQRIGNSDADAARMALQSGLQLELPNNFGFKHLPKLIEDEKVDVALIDQAVRSVLALKSGWVYLRRNAVGWPKGKALIKSKSATELAREAAGNLLFY